jgi:hypothetical protein
LKFSTEIARASAGFDSATLQFKTTFPVRRCDPRNPYDAQRHDSRRGQRQIIGRDASLLPAARQVGAGNDFITAFNANDTIYAEAGNDQVFGGDGADVLFGGGGNDTLAGENGLQRVIR